MTDSPFILIWRLRSFDSRWRMILHSIWQGSSLRYDEDSLFEMRDSSPSCLRSKWQSFTVINKRGILQNSERKIISKRAVFLTLKRESFRSDKHGQKALKTLSSQKESPVYRKNLLSPFRTDYPPWEELRSNYPYFCYGFTGLQGVNERYAHTFQ